MADTGRRAPLAQLGRNNSNGGRQQTPASKSGPEAGQADPPGSPSDTQSAETQMRRALGLGTGPSHHTPQQRPEQARARHRFVQDGGVPVVMLSQKTDPEITTLRERIAALEHTLEVERTAHQATRRNLHEQSAQTQALQTRMAHNDLAHQEALAQERHAREAAQAALQETLAASPRRARPAPLPAASQEAPVALDHEEPEPIPSEASIVDTSQRATTLAPAAAAPVEKPRRGRPRIHPIPEPKPVRWWTPSFRSKTKA